MSEDADDLPKDVLIAAACVVVMLPTFRSIEATSDAIDRVAQAILAERERCAKLVESFVDPIDVAHFIRSGRSAS